MVVALNHWGARERFLVKVLSEYLVFVAIALVLLWITYRAYQRKKPLTEFKPFITDLLLQGLFLVAIPVGLATLISEVISQLYVRQRPFAAMIDIKLLVPHGADGGMPSHHMVFMASLAGMVYISSKRFGTFLLSLTVLSGLGRISAGIHYPSDVVAGILLAGLTVFSYPQITVSFSKIPFNLLCGQQRNHRIGLPDPRDHH